MRAHADTLTRIQKENYAFFYVIACEIENQLTRQIWVIEELAGRTNQLRTNSSSLRV